MPRGELAPEEGGGVSRGYWSGRGWNDDGEDEPVIMTTLSL